MHPIVNVESDPITSVKGLHFEQLNHKSEDWMPRHAHRQPHLVYILSGTVHDTRKGQTFLREPASLTFLPAEEPHATLCHKGCIAFQIVLEPEWLERIRHFRSFLERPEDYREGPTVWLTRRIYREFQCRDNLTGLMLEGMVLELLAEIARNPSEPTERQVSPWLVHARDYLHAHFTESISMKEIASAVEVHPSHLMRGFRQQYHCTIGDYVRKLRVEYACHLLTHSGTVLAEIAVAAGFADQSHFNRTFKGITGMTPLSYQETCQRAPLRQQTLL